MQGCQLRRMLCIYQTFNTLILFLVSDPKNTSKFSFGLLKRILSYSKPYKTLFALAVVLTLTLSSLAIVRPLLINQTLNVIGIEDASAEGYLFPSDKLEFINRMGLLLIGM